MGGTLTEHRVDGPPVVLTIDASAGDASKGVADAAKSTDSGQPDASPPPSSNGIEWHGGPIQTNPPKIYFVWYGSWQNDLSRTILPDWATGIGASAYWAINTTYVDGNGHHVPASASFGGQSYDYGYSHGKSLTDTDVMNIVFGAITQKMLPKDPDGVYFVLAYKDVAETTGFCNKYCGWHAAATMNGTWIRYAFIGDGDRCPGACEAQQVSPNLSAKADGMASVLSHELEETVTDPLGSAWFDKSGQENADKCAWTFGATSIAKNGGRYNMTFGGREWLIQQNWVNAKGGYCALKL
jgi:hypothetical protein